MSANEFYEFKNILTSRKEELIENIKTIKDDLGGLYGDEANDEADFALVNTDSLIGESLSFKLVQEIEDIDYVLSKIDKGTYGTCEMCEEPIGKERLELKPHARYCVECREMVEKMIPSNTHLNNSYKHK